MLIATVEKPIDGRRWGCAPAPARLACGEHVAVVARDDELRALLADEVGLLRVRGAALRERSRDDAGALSEHAHDAFAVLLVHRRVLAGDLRVDALRAEVVRALLRLVVRTRPELRGADLVRKLVIRELPRVVAPALHISQARVELVLLRAELRLRLRLPAAWPWLARSPPRTLLHIPAAAFVSSRRSPAALICAWPLMSLAMFAVLNAAFAAPPRVRPRRERCRLRCLHRLRLLHLAIGLHLRDGRRATSRALLHDVRERRLLLPRLHPARTVRLRLAVVDVDLPACVAWRFLRLVALLRVELRLIFGARLRAAVVVVLRVDLPALRLCVILRPEQTGTNPPIPLPITRLLPVRPPGRPSARCRA